MKTHARFQNLHKTSGNSDGFTNPKKKCVVLFQSRPSSITNLWPEDMFSWKKHRHPKKNLKKTRFFNFCGDTVSPPKKKVEKNKIFQFLWRYGIATHRHQKKKVEKNKIFQFLWRYGIATHRHQKKQLKKTKFFNFCGDTVSPHIAIQKKSWKKQDFSISTHRHQKKKVEKKIKKKIFQFTPKKFEKTKIFEFLWRSGIATYCHTSPPKEFFFFFSVAIPYCHTSPPKEKSLKQRHFFVFRCDTGTRYRHVLPHIATKWKKRYKNHFFVFRGDTGTATYCHTSPPKEKKNKNVIFFFSVAIPVPPHIATHRHPRKKRFKKVIFFVFRGDAGTATYCHTSPPKEKN